MDQRCVLICCCRTISFLSEDSLAKPPEKSSWAIMRTSFPPALGRNTRSMYFPIHASSFSVMPGQGRLRATGGVSEDDSGGQRCVPVGVFISRTMTPYLCSVFMPPMPPCVVDGVHDFTCVLNRSV